MTTDEPRDLTAHGTSFHARIAARGCLPDQGQSKCPDQMTLHAFYVHAFVSASPQDLRDATRVILVRLVSHRRQCRRPPGLQADDFVSGRLQPIGEVLRQCASLKTN